MEQMAALECVCAGVCILVVVLTPFSSLALYPSFTSESQMSARNFLSVQELVSATCKQEG